MLTLVFFISTSENISIMDFVCRWDSDQEQHLNYNLNKIHEADNILWVCLYSTV